MQHLILACVAWRGPQTSYELKDYVSRTVGWLWQFQHAQLYTEPPKLVSRGLLLEAVEKGGRRRRTYSITDDGTTEVRRWLAAPTTKPPELRDLALLKHHFGALADPADMVGLAQAKLELERSRRQALVDALASSDHDANHRRFVRSGARYGLTLIDGAIRFWEDVTADPDRRYENDARDGDLGPWERPS